MEWKNINANLGDIINSCFSKGIAIGRSTAERSPGVTVALQIHVATPRVSHRCFEGYREGRSIY